MIKKTVTLICLLGLIASTSIDWGFFGHRNINRYAVFTLPQEMLGLFKSNIDYLTFHAIDPDKRRYAIKNEATRHYIDIDNWEVLPFDTIPRDFEEAIFKYGLYRAFASKNDTLQVPLLDSLLKTDTVANRVVFDDRYSNEIDIPFDSITNSEVRKLLSENNIEFIRFDNQLAAYGVLPYFLEEFYDRLVYVFEKGETNKILKIAADIGHYIADGHVPLHTTLNYNGQLTGQDGIHGFWESRLPELFAEEEYDFLSGKAEYIEDKRAFFWDMISDSHAHVPDVLGKEMELRQSFPSEQQLCFDDRGDYTSYVQCPEFSKAYHEAMEGMVEERFRASITAVGSIWYSAWVDAGQPPLDGEDKLQVVQEEPDRTILNSNHHQE